MPGAEPATRSHAAAGSDVGVGSANVEPAVLVTGASGLVGTWRRRTVPPGTELVGLVHRRAVPVAACVTADRRIRDALAADGDPSIPR